jgi:hypothetical protein
MGAVLLVRRSAWLTATIALAIAAGACANPSADPRSTSASESYTLRDFEIVYPYDGTRDVASHDGRASVSFTANWPGSGFPGYAKCFLTLEGGGGEVAGDMRFQLISGSDGVRGAPIVVPVSDEPAAATGSCTDDGRDDTSRSGYLFSGPIRIWAYTSPHELQEPDAPPLGQVDVDFEHPGKNPGMRTCYLYVTRADGTDDPPVKYGMLVGEGPVVFDVRGEPETIASARVTCGPLEA